ncbi:MAG TPA: PRC-barrel domain-containing protein [Candidatus Baltobacteraceae bacterium]|nr:PRC-barrel domain-containing protein [Candidatus Baltobacteraceae bacterium]
MKTLFSTGAAIAILGLAAAPISGQTQSTTTTSTSYVQTSKLVGTNVKSSQGEEIGVIKDVVLDRNTGCMAYTVLSTGGTGTRVTSGSKTVAVPWAVYSPTSDLSVLTVTVDRERIYNAPVFDYARINEYTTTNYINNVYSYYGVSAGVGVSGATTTTTGVAGAAGAPASPGASPTAALSPTAAGSPAATGSPATTASPAGRGSPTPHGTAAASPRATAPTRPHATASPRANGAATASPSERGTRGARSRPGASPSPGDRSETTPPSEEERAPSEATESPSEGKKSTRQRKTERSPEGEPSATPPSPEEQE